MHTVRKRIAAKREIIDVIGNLRARLCVSGS
jgi:hypothetical protein